jgi:hypothetical protein
MGRIGEITIDYTRTGPKSHEVMVRRWSHLPKKNRLGRVLELRSPREGWRTIGHVGGWRDDFGDTKIKALREAVRQARANIRANHADDVKYAAKLAILRTQD